MNDAMEEHATYSAGEDFNVMLHQRNNIFAALARRGTSQGKRITQPIDMRDGDSGRRFGVPAAVERRHRDRFAQ
jgi:hypothetical protein